MSNCRRKAYDSSFRRSPHKGPALSTRLCATTGPLSRMLIPRKAFGALTFVLCIAGLFIFSNSIVRWSVYLFGSHAPLIPYTTHVVLFQFKETASAFARKEVRTLQNASRTGLTSCRSRQSFWFEEVVCASGYAQAVHSGDYWWERYVH